MKVTHTSTMKTTLTPWVWCKNVMRLTLAALGWTALIFTTLLTAYLTGWILFTAARVHKGPAEEIIPLFVGFLVITAALAWLMGRFLAPRGAVQRTVLALVLIVLIGEVIWTQVYPTQALFWARQLGWGESSQKDYELFPERAIGNAAPAFHFKQGLSPELFQTVEYRFEDGPRKMDFEEFLESTQTTSFIVIKDDTILYEGYFNGYSRDSVLTSFSVAKSFTSALVGIAIDEGYIGSVDDRMITYLPELKGRGLDDVTIRDLLMMSAGIRYVSDDEGSSPLGELTQFTDSGLSYNYPDLRQRGLLVKADGKAPGTEFNYNNYDPILLGMILERTTGRPVSEYLQEKIWKPLGMEYPASWSLDSEESGFELMGSGVNARAIDFAKFGRLFLNNGNWNGSQIVSSDWVFSSTSPAPNDHRSWRSDVYWKETDGYYKYMWWGKFRPDGGYDYTALGHLGQRIYVSPQENMIVVRFGLDEGGVIWEDVFQTIIADVNEQTTSLPTLEGWQVSTPEEQGFDSARAAEGLLAIKENGTSIHSLMVVRNDKVILDAYFYPYDGSIYHDLASVTKSVMTTLIGIAADQGKLSLDDSMLSFFPDREIANRDERKEKITVGHLASMSSGLECDRIDEITMLEMRDSQDWVQFALDRRIVREPGTDFAYCGLNMHLLSAILQEATGMSALEFAQQNLFGPLGITNVYWPADPQGVTHGWGDLSLRPPDMAKLGSLFLHQGEWNGKQIVSRDWVESALQARMQGTGKIEDYGYGWWIGQPSNEPEFLATGNGGQKIKVYPNLDLIVVTTGGGFEYSEIQPYFLAAMSDMEKPLPANPAGVVSLDAALNAIAEGPQPEPIPPLPATASAISGHAFIFEPNRIGLQSIRLDFDEPQGAEAIFQLELANEPGPRVVGVGLDGVYRSSHSGRPIIARGHWSDAQTFVIDYNEGPGFAAYTFRLQFEGDKLVFEVPGLGRFEASREGA